MISFTVAQLAARVGGEVHGEPDRVITGIATLGDAGPDHLSHLSAASYRNQLPSSGAGVVLLRQTDLPACPGSAIVVANPYLAYARISQLFWQPPAVPAGVAATAVVDPSATLGSGVAVAPGAVIGAHVLIGDGCSIGANVVLGDHAQLGDGCLLYPSVVLYHGVRLGARVVVHSGAVLGADGFGFTPDSFGHLQRIAQLGTVLVGDDCDIGANTTIDRGALGDTLIGQGVKIDNQVQIGHNTRIGDHSIICGCTGIVGSSTIGRHCVLAGGVGIGGDGPVHLADGVVVSGMTHISQSVQQPGVYASGTLHEPASGWKRNALRFRDLDAMAKRLRRLERAMAAADNIRPDGGNDSSTESNETQ